jgi:hypothetical protein
MLDFSFEKSALPIESSINKRTPSYKIMSKYSKDKIEGYKSIIRRLIVVKGDITCRQIASALKINKNYAAKLLRKIHKENTHNIKRDTMEVQLGIMEMHFRAVIENQWKIINDTERERKEFFDSSNPKFNLRGELIPSRIDYGAFLVSPSAKIQAAKTIIEAFEKLFKIKFDAGIFSRKLGDITATIPLAEIIAKVNELTGENKFEWQKNCDSEKYNFNKRNS